MILLDTNIIVEALRGNVSYKNELDEMDYENFCISSITKPELISGCRSKEHFFALKKDLKKIQIYNIVEEISEISNQLLYTLNKKIFIL